MHFESWKGQKWKKPLKNFEKIRKIRNGLNGILRGPGKADLWKKTLNWKSRVRLPLKANNKYINFSRFCMHNTQKTIRQKIFTPGISEQTVQRGRVRSEIINIDRYKNTAGFFVIPPLSQLWEEKN